MNKKSLLILTLLSLPLLAILLYFFGGRSSPAETPTAFPIEVTDQLGRLVRLEKAPQRIVSLAPSNTEILFALGLGEQVVGVTDYDDYPPEAQAREKIGGFSTPDIEKVVALSPDLILAAAIHEKEVIPGLEARNLTVMALAPKTVDQVLEAITLVGKVTGKEEAAAQLVGNLSQRIEAVRNLVAGIPSPEKPRVLYIIWHEPLFTAGQGTWHDQLITLAGGENIFHDLTGYPTVDLEAVLERNPQVIIANSGRGEASSLPLQWAETESRLSETEARQQGRVYEIDANIVDRPGPRIVDGLEEMLRLLHPELLKE